jgi:hypothetical protein
MLRERSHRRDYIAAVRARRLPPGTIDELSYLPYNVPGGLQTRRYGIDGAITTRQSLWTPTANKGIRLVRVLFILEGTADAQWLEVYWGTATNIAAAATGEPLWYAYFDAIGEEDSHAWAPGRGPVAPVNAVLSVRCQNANVGQSIAGTTWWTEE